MELPYACTINLQICIVGWCFTLSVPVESCKKELMFYQY